MSAKVKFHLITPEKHYFKGEIEMLSVTTDYNGQETFLPNHSWCCLLLDKDSTVTFRDTEGVTRKALVDGGYVDIHHKFVVYSDHIKWVE